MFTLHIFVRRDENCFIGNTLNMVLPYLTILLLSPLICLAELIAIAHSHGVRILIDGAQSVSHIPVNVSARCIAKRAA